MLAARLRNWGLWTTDFIQGSPLRRHCEDIEARLASGESSADRLEDLLRYAAEQVPFYAPFQAFRSLQDFPVINKSVIKEHAKAFRSNEFQGRPLHVMRTSGSTGTPFAVVQDPEKRWRVLAEMICFGRRAGYEAGDRYVFTRVWNEHNRKPWHVALRENAVMFDISYLDDARMEELRLLLHQDGNIRCLLGYPSTLEPLSRCLERRGDGPEAYHLRTIISISEWLPPHVRASLKSHLGCQVVSRYSNQENGVLAQQCLDGEEFHLNTASYHFEYLKLDGDAPADPGERARIVVTDLFNRAMPMIRYDTGDVVVRQPEATCGWRTQTLREVEGRRLDFIYDTRDRLLSPVVVCNHFWSYTGLRQYQFIQEAKGKYRLLLNGAWGLYPDEEFIRLAKGFLGADASVSIVHVDHIPQLASGKFAVVVSRYRPDA